MSLSRSTEKRFEAKLYRKSYYTALSIAIRNRMNGDFVRSIIHRYYKFLIFKKDENEAEKILSIFKDYVVREEISEINEKEKSEFSDRVKKEQKT